MKKYFCTFFVLSYFISLLAMDGTKQRKIKFLHYIQAINCTFKDDEEYCDGKKLLSEKEMLEFNLRRLPDPEMRALAQGYIERDVVENDLYGSWLKKYLVAYGKNLPHGEGMLPKMCVKNISEIDFE